MGDPTDSMDASTPPPEARTAVDEAQHDICGLCGEGGADKMALWTGGGIYWPGEAVPATDMVHQACEQAETTRAHSQLTQAERDAVLRSIL